MIRELYLVNEAGTTYFFDERNKTLISDIGDLGFSKNNTYLKYDDVYDLVKSENPQVPIKFKLVFLEGYSGYTSFLSFYRKSTGNLRLFYKCGGSSKYCSVVIKSLTKTQLEGKALYCDLTLDKLSLWFLKESFTIRVDEDENGKIFPFSYPFTYSASYKGTINITNNGETKAPLNIAIYGAVDNPVVEILKNGEVISKLRLVVSSDDCVIEVNSEPRDQYMIMTENGIVTNIYQTQDFTCDNFLFLDKGTYQIRFAPGVSEDTFCRITKLEGYSGH